MILTVQNYLKVKLPRVNEMRMCDCEFCLIDVITLRYAALR